MLLSIVTPVSRLAGQLENLASWLERAIDLGIEVILVHDVQDTNTSKELQNLYKAIEKSNLHFIEGNFGSPGAARNIGLASTTGEWVMFWDGDDVGDIERTLSELSVAENENYDALVFQYDVRKINASNDGFTTVFQSNTYNVLSVAANPGLWRMCFKGELARKHRFQPISMAEDQMFLVEISLPKLRIFFSSEVSYHYYIGRLGQLTSNSQAIKDLNLTIRDLRTRLSQEVDEFKVILLLRQSITAIKRGQIKLKSLGAISLFIFLLTQPRHSYQGLKQIKLNT